MIRECKLCVRTQVSGHKSWNVSNAASERIAMQRGNAACILGTSTDDDFSTEFCV